MTKISFIGFGNLAKAIAKGLAKSQQYQIFAAAPSLSVGENAPGITTHNDNLAVLNDADIIILAVKPAQMKAVYQEIKSHIPGKSLIISLAAGITLSWFAKENDKPQPLIRAMPNIASALELGATPMLANQWTSLSQQQMAESLFNTVGITTWVKKEAELNSFTALSGSGPAYVFLFMEAMIEAAMSMGLEKNIAQSFALQTVKGAVNLAEKNNQDIAALRKKVTSAKGTTAAALAVFEDRELLPIVKAAMEAASKRAEEVEAGF